MKVKRTILIKNIYFTGSKQQKIKKNFFFNKNITFKFDITHSAEYNAVPLNFIVK